ncbi:MAG: UvrD-helicase domain-containing protein [Bacilli bacterium]|nr:UvrD-helicase domain-containing protein [Bacilli bacterium]
MQLNDKQLEAVNHVDGPMLVLAGAGSGKTKVLTSRIANLIENGVSPYNILAITFTNKAAKEMKDRVEKLIGSMAHNIQISTFHSLGLKILKENYNLLGYERNFTIIDSDDVLTIIKKIMKDLNMSKDYYNPRELRNKISSAKNEMMGVEAFSKVEFDHKVVEVYKRYVNKLKNGNSIDFDDLLILPIKLFKNYPSILEDYQNRYKYILIDEYQDTNEAQYVLSKLLSSKYRNIFVVGDNDQAIYAFRGANYKNILNFEKDYPEAKTVLLEENYRSTKTILNAANNVIKNNRERKDKNLWSNNDNGSKIKYRVVQNEKEEASFVASEIKELITKGIKEEDIAVLYRTNAQSRVIEEEMLKKNIKYRIVGSFYFYNRKEIKDLLCYLRLINNHKDDISLLRVINTPKRGIGEKTLDNLSNIAIENNTSIYETISGGKELEFKKLIEELTNSSETLSLTELIDNILDKSGIKKELTSSKLLEDEIRLENLNEFKSITKSYEEEYGSATLGDFLEEISLVSDMTEHQDGANRVSLMTVHSVKGLEFDHVFIVGMEEGIFPHYNAINDGGSSAIEEERRLCYVAITRAKKELYIISAESRMLFGNTNRNMPSRFIEEIDKEYLDIEEKRSVNRIVSKIKKTIDKNAVYEVGERINHTDFGEGIVISIDKSILTVAFPHPTGIKKLMKGHPNITKL